MPSDKRNSLMAIATGSISLLFNFALSGDVPFCQLQQFQCLYHGSIIIPKLTFVLLCTPFLSPYHVVTICGTRFMALVQGLGSAVQAGVLLGLLFA